MPNNQTVHDRISEVEVEAIRGRLPGRDFQVSGPSTVQDISEATGIPAEQVRAHLSRLRAEKAFDRPATRAFPVIPAVGVLALCAGAFVLWQRREPEIGVAPHVKPVMPVAVRPAANRAIVEMRSGEMGITRGPGVPPPGIRVCVNGQYTQFEGFGQDETIPRMPFDMACQQLSRALAYLAVRSALDDIHVPDKKSMPFRDSMGNEVTPRPGYAHYSINGWAGEASGWIKLPEFGDVLKDYWTTNQWAKPGAPEAFLAPYAANVALDLKTVGPELLKNVAKLQEAGLSASGVDWKKGIVSPPPGYTVTFLGRRKESQSGPLFAFSPMNEKAAAARLSLAIRNALYRDSLPPTGTWTEADRIASKAPEPKLARVQITGPGSTEYSFDLPTRGSGLSATLAKQSAIAAEAVRAANANALTEPTDRKSNE